jgi:hypothetical protein
VGLARCRGIRPGPDLHLCGVFVFSRVIRAAGSRRGYLTTGIATLFGHVGEAIERKAARTFAAARLLPDGQPHPHAAVAPSGAAVSLGHGVSMAYSFNDAKAADRHETQYFEMVCNRGIYHKGWTAVTRHGNLPWVAVGPQPSLSADVWELYDTTKDWSQAHDLAKELPEKLAELKRLFDLEASKYNVFPLDDRKAERANPDLAGRPSVVHGTTQLLFPGMRRIQENAVINTKNKSHSVTAEVEVPTSGAKGVIVAQGGSMGGWSLYALEGKLKYFYNFLGMLHFDVTATSPLPPGTHQARMEFAYDGGGIGKGATVTLYVDGEKVGEGRVGRTHALFFSMDETAEVGCDVGEPVSPDYGSRGNSFSGKVKWVQIDIDAAAKDVDHMIAAEERFMVAMARQ